jgi:ribonuclease P protein component
LIYELMNEQTPARTNPPRQSLTGLRLRRHADYQTAYKAARKHQSTSMSWFLAPQAAHEGKAVGTARVGLTVGKVLGPSHERNRIKRRMRDCLRKHTDLLPAGFDLIFHPRRSVLTLEYRKLESEVVRILTQAQKEAEGVRAALPTSQNTGLKKSNDAQSNEVRKTNSHS